MTPATTASAHSVLEILVSDHPCVLAQVCSLCVRRTYRVAGMLTAPTHGNPQRRIWLLLDEEARLEQIQRQLLKLEDVRAVHRHAADHPAFAAVADLRHALTAPS